jgi:hypothetical protein
MPGRRKKGINGLMVADVAVRAMPWRDTSAYLHRGIASDPSLLLGKSKPKLVLVSLYWLDVPEPFSSQTNRTWHC